MKAQNFPSKGWVLYDGDCALCIAMMRRWKGLLARHGYAAATLQSAWVARCLKLSKTELLAEMRLLTSEGDLYAGADAFLQVMRQIWWTWPLYVVLSLPGLRQLAKSAYRYVAARRHCLTAKACERPR